MLPSSRLLLGAGGDWEGAAIQFNAPLGLWTYSAHQATYQDCWMCGWNPVLGPRRSSW